ncbi:FKBP-type peptidyl-prolyl cis-trans isomerase [Streptomyces roseus]|uniref:FKBP-type peptidyl-prolyl cis-trans isomerase n=1 Tax=Streptomyces roseus TaxID=66430 RepID=UPI00381A62FE
MRRLSGLLFIPLLLLAAACGGEHQESDSVEMKNSRVPAITKGAKFGEKPTLSAGKGDPPKELKVKVISEGKGPVLKKGDIAQVHYLGMTWDGKEPFDQSFDRGAPLDLTIGADRVIKGWDQSLEGKKVGSRVELVVPPSLGYGKQGSGDKIKPDATLIFVVDILKGTSVPATVKGKQITQDNENLPKVGMNTDGKEVSLSVPKDVAPPTRLVSSYVLEGEGPAVKDTDSVVVRFLGKTWNGEKPFQSTYTTNAPATWKVNQLPVKGLKDGLKGKKVGSRILIVIPPDQGFGDKEQGAIPANSTLVLALDILAVQ